MASRSDPDNLSGSGYPNSVQTPVTKAGTPRKSGHAPSMTHKHDPAGRLGNSGGAKLGSVKGQFGLNGRKY